MRTGPESPQGLPLHQALLGWFAENARPLPWRRSRDPYPVLVSEIMLQQTQVERVIQKYQRFLERFPTFAALAAAASGDVIRAWEGLGYNRRALHLWRIARAVVEEHDGVLPQDIAVLRKLPGIGEYTAAALACFAQGQDVPVIDTNVRRVLGRVLFGPGPVAPRDLRSAASGAVPPGQAWAWNQALMDLGATVCHTQGPACPQCPLLGLCRAAPAFADGTSRVAEEKARYQAKAGPFRGSRRYYRGRIVAYLRGLEDGDPCTLETLGPAVRPGFQEGDGGWLLALVQGLAQEGLVTLTGSPSGQGWKNVRVGLPQG